MKQFSASVIFIIFASVMAPIAYASTHTPSLHYQIKNYSQYPMTWGYSQSTTHGGGVSPSSNGVLAAGSISNPQTTDVYVSGYFYYSGKRAFHSRSCYGGNYRITITDGINVAPFDFTAKVPCSDSENSLSVTGSGTILPPPDTTDTTQENTKGVVVCGWSSKYGVSNKASAYADYTYSISIYDASQLSKDNNGKPTCPAAS